MSLTNRLSPQSYTAVVPQAGGTAAGSRGGRGDAGGQSTRARLVRQPRAWQPGVRQPRAWQQRGWQPRVGSQAATIKITQGDTSKHWSLEDASLTTLPCGLAR